MKLIPLRTLVYALLLLTGARGADPEVIPVWPSTPPGETGTLPAEHDTTGPKGRMVAGQRVTRITDVSVPTLTIFRPAPDKDTGTAVIVCPGGGYKILAFDLEGTEVAQWLSGIGVTGIVLKYRVPARPGQPEYLAAVQDLQRAMSLVRSRAAEWKLNPAHIGVCGFSAGGNAAGLTSTFGNDRKYAAADEVDQVACRPDFGLLIYPGDFWDKATGRLSATVKIPANMPPQFLVQNMDDPISPLNAILFAEELSRHKVPAEMHIYAQGGHGIGLRSVAGLACTTWPAACEVWLRASKFIP